MESTLLFRFFKTLCFFFLLSYSTTAWSIDVTNSNDSGAGSLRQAILDANASSSSPISIFILPNFVSFYTALPALTVPVNIFFNTTTCNINGSGSISGPLFPLSGAGKITFNSRANLTSNFGSRTFVVTTTGNGDGSLKQAIDYADQTDAMDYITFNIPGIAPQSIALAADAHVYYPLQIDGSSQPTNGYSGTLPKINLSGLALYSHANTSKYAGLTFDNHLIISYLNTTSSANTVTIGESGKPNFFRNGSFDIFTATNVTFQNNWYGIDDAGNISSAFKFSAQNCTGLIITKNVICKDMDIATNTNVNITSNKIGTDPAGTLSKADVSMRVSSTNTTIGGNTSEKNIICGLIEIRSSNVTIKNNNLGVAIDGMTPLTSGLITSGSNLIQNIIINSNTIPGGILFMNGQQVTITNNQIGLAADGATLLPSSGYEYGIGILGGSDYTIGSLITGDDNFIAGKKYGVFASPNIDKLKIRGNHFFENTIKGIELKGFGMGAYKPLILSTGANTISGTALANSTVDIYYNNTENCIPQGKSYIATVTTDGSGNWTYTNSTNFTVSNGIVVTATSTAGSTSEFSEYIVADAGADATICKGSTHQLGSGTANAAYTYAWTPSSSLNQTSVFNPTATPFDTTQYVLSVYNQNNCYLNDTVTVAVNKLPNLAITNPDAVCSPQTIDITGSYSDLSNSAGVVSYWTDASTTVTLNNPEAIATSNTYYIKKYNHGCVDVKPITVTISTCTSIESEVTETGLIAYPNPAQQKITIESNEFGFNYQISNNNGIVLLQGNAEDKILNLEISSLESGTYHLKVTSQDKTYFKKFIKL